MSIALVLQPIRKLMKYAKLYWIGIFIITITSFLFLRNANAEVGFVSFNQTGAALLEQGAENTDGGSTIYLPLVASSGTSRVAEEDIHEERPPQPVMASSSHATHTGNADVGPPIPNNHTFVADTGGDLDQYLGRVDLPNGLLTFPIEINAPVLNPSEVGTDGFPTASAFFTLVDRYALPKYAFLQLQIYDVDDELVLDCPQIDHVYINGRQIEDVKQTAPAVLRGGNEQWLTWSTWLPAYMLKFPTASGVNGQPPTPVLNEISIAVDTACYPPHWKLEVDWGALSLRPNLNYPLLFVHGWTGSTDTFLKFDEYAQGNDYQTHRPDFQDGVRPLPETVVLLANEIDNATTMFGVDKVNILSHSRGGIFTRSALRTNPQLASKINAYVTFSTPHHGVDAPVNYLSNDTEWWPWLNQILDQCREELDQQQCQEAAETLTKEHTRIFNYGDGCHLQAEKDINPWDLTFPAAPSWVGCEPQWLQGSEDKVTAYTIVGGVGDVEATSATFPWVAWAAGEFPFPDTVNVDKEYLLLTHTSIVSDTDVYEYVLNLLDSRPDSPNVSAASAETAANAQANTQSLTVSPTDAQTLFYISGSLPVGGILSYTMPLEAITEARFHVSAHAPISFTLVDPLGQSIDPDVATVDPQITYFTEPGDTGVTDPYWLYQYQVQNPTNGLWQVQIAAGTATEFKVYAEIDSPLHVLAFPSAGSYRPGETVLIQAALLNDNIIQTGATITGTLLFPDDTSLPLAFYDDGTHGDTTASNSVFTAQLTAPVVNGRPRFVVRATKGGIMRTTDDIFTIAAQTATFQQVVRETPIDINNNGYYDKLDIDIALDVLTAGDYVIQGTLADSNGNVIAPAAYSTFYVGTPLATGVQTVTLSFAGKTLREAGANGPYSLKQVQINYYDPAAYDMFTVDTAENVYTTTSYTVNQFEGELLQMTGSSDGAEDVNSDGIYDSLQISVTFDVRLPGAYNWVGELVDATGAHVTGASGSGTLNSQAPAVFTFGGWQIHNAGLNGPYRLTNVYVTKTTGQVFTEYFDDLHTTAAYQASQFGSLPLLLTNVQHQLVDRNSNGLADRLVMSATLSAMVLDGAYDWSGRLTDPNGVEIGTTAGTSQLYDGKTLVFAFINTPLIRNSGLNGPFSLRDVTITSRATPTITASFPVVYTTPAYPATQFEAWNFSFTNNSATVSDLDNNGLYDKLTFATTLSVPWAGPYRLDSKLIALQPTERTLITYTRFSTYAGVSSESFTFDGPDLAQDGVDGPYLLRITGVYADDSIPALSLAITQDLTTTLPYSATQFQSFPLLPPPDAPVLAQPLNDDNDGNYLMTWSTIPDATGYELQEHRVSILLPPYETIYTGTAPSFAISGRTGGTYAYRVRTMRGAQVSGWSQSINVAVDNATPTPTPTKTTTPTPTATLSPTPTPVPTLLTNAVIYLSSESGGTVSGIPFADSDLLSYNTVTGVWSMVFDGSDVGVTTDLDAVQVESDGTLLLSFDNATTLASVGTVEDEDLVRFTPTSLGDTTAGSFSWVFDGSDVGLDTADEDIDALARPPDGKLVISTVGAFSANGVSGSDKHLFVFTASSLGETTSGTWAVYFDGSDVGLTTATENIWGAEIMPNSGDIYLTTISIYAVTGVSGDSDDLFTCVPGTLGETTSCTFSLYWDGDSYGVGSEWLDALAISTTPLTVTASADRTTTAPVNPIFLPLIRR